MSSSTHTHWRMTINNYDPTDLALVQQGYPDHIRQLVYTLEKGEDGTPHVQAYIKMKRDCRLSHMKKLFPRGNFGYLDTLEYKLNSQRYAQKLDSTAESGAVISNGDPLHTIEGTIRVVIERMRREYEDEPDLYTARRWVEKDMVLEDYTMAKVFVSATYKTMWKEFGHDMYESLSPVRVEEQEVNVPTHTHTHSREILSRLDTINNGCGRLSEEDSEESEGQDDEGDEECESEADGYATEGSGDDSGEVSDCSEC